MYLQQELRIQKAKVVMYLQQELKIQKKKSHVFTVRAEDSKS